MVKYLLRLPRPIFLAIGGPLILGLWKKSFRENTFKREFSGYGRFFVLLQDGRYLPLWARPIYHLWIRPLRMYAMDAKRRRMSREGERTLIAMGFVKAPDGRLVRSN